MKVKYLPKNLKFGSTKLHHGFSQKISPQPDGVRRANETCIELETYSNITRSGSAGFIALSVLSSVIFLIIIASFIGTETKTLLAALAWTPAAPCFALIIYFASGSHRCRGAYIRINRMTRKMYFIYPNNKKQMHSIEWNKIEAVAGLIPIVSSHGYSSRHPLYLFAIDYNMSPPTEICAACGNLGILDNGRSARALWEYLQHFMANGLEGLPEPTHHISRLSRRDAAIQPYRKWAADFRNQHRKPYAWLWLPLTIPASLFLLFFQAYPDSFEAWIQYNVPYVAFPRENDFLCGFAENRKPSIRLNGIKLDQ